MERGAFIVLEGTDGSGKSTQYALLKERLEKRGHDVVTIQFPRYDEPSSYFLREYLRGNYGAADAVGPYTASLFYALDRYQTARDIRRYLEAGKIVLCDRFTASNMAHQGAKIDNPDVRRGYFIWLDNLEFTMLDIPRPSLTLVLYTPFEYIRDRLEKKEQSSTAVKKDIHEADSEHISKSIEVYLDMCRMFPNDFTRIDGVRDGKLLDIQAVNDLLWEKITPLLPEPSRRRKPALAPALAEPAVTANPYVEKANGRTKITPAGYQYLDEVLSSAHGNVYVFNGKLSSLTVAAAMARLSRRGDDLRITLLDEFAQAQDKDQQLLRRVITAYGDDSVQQLAGVHVVVEKASNLLTKKLEWGRLAAYLEQSTRYIYYDQQDEAGNYKYYVPENLDPATKLRYHAVMSQIFALYSDMVHQLTEYIQKASPATEAERDGAWRSATKAEACDAVRAALPVATESTVGIFASGQALESLVMHLLSDELPEAQTAGQQLLEEARKVIPVLLERADKPDRGGAFTAYRAETRQAMKQLAQKYLPANYANIDDAVTLTGYWPRNELDLVPDMLYEFSDQPLDIIRREVDQWPYEKKIEVLQAYAGERLNRRQRPGRALEKAHYSFDIVSDYGSFRDLQRHRIVDDLEWQALTPRYGYEVPDLVEEAGLTEKFEHCFDLSLQLYSELQQTGYLLEAQYAVLLGHRLRWKVTYNAREAFHLHELRTSPQAHRLYRQIVRCMHQKVAEVHPLLAREMKFVNNAEDPALARLAAERYTQFKLEQLGTSAPEPSATKTPAKPKHQQNI